MRPPILLRMGSVLAFGALTLLGTGCELGPACREEVTTLSSAAAQEEGSPVAELLADVVGEYRLTMEYEREDFAFIDVAPPQPSTELVLTVSHDGGEARFVDRIRKRETDAQGEEISCTPDTLEVDAVASLRSADGLLDETFEMTLVRTFLEDGTASGQARFDRGFGPDDVEGSATIVDVHPEDPETIELAFTTIIDRHEIRGSWAGSLTYENSAVWPTIATWWGSR